MSFETYVNKVQSASEMTFTGYNDGGRSRSGHQSSGGRGRCGGWNEQPSAGQEGGLKPFSAQAYVAAYS